MKKNQEVRDRIRIMTKNKTQEQNAPLHVVLFCSRNKDNAEVEGFVQRNRKFLTEKTPIELMERFNEFVFSGVPGEMCRFYISVNARDNEKVRRGLIHWLVDNPDQDMGHIESRTVAIAAKSECRAEKKWMFDFDEDVSLLDDFIADIKSCDDRVEVETFTTPNGMCIVTSRGFDTRKLDLQDKWKNVELKKDENRCFTWKTKR